MNRCSRCVLPDTRPDTPFIDGVCAACLTYERRPEIDWAGRREQLIQLLDRFHGECIVPSSGGKDSHAQVIQLQELGAHVTVVTASTCHLTALGRANIDNLAHYTTTIEVSPNKTVRATLNKLGLELVGDISWPEHVSIFTIPFKVAASMGIPLIFYGENPQNQYGGPMGTEDALTMTRRWRSEFGGFLGLRPADMIGKMGITKRDMEDYMLPEQFDLAGGAAGGQPVEAHFLGQYLPWDSHHNAEIAIKAGMRYELPSEANWWAWENLDNAQTGLHDHLMYRKYGYGRFCAQISVDIRAGRVSRERALEWVQKWDGLFPEIYAGVSFSAACGHIGMDAEAVMKQIDAFTNWSLFIREDNGRLRLKEKSS